MTAARKALTLLSLFALGSCATATPFRGPGYDAKLGVTLPGGEPVVVAVTQATLGDDADDRAAFWDHVSRVEASLTDRPGFIGYSKRASVFGGEAWTMTVWADETSLTAFVRSDAHQAAIREAFGGLADARFARFAIAREDVPVSWDEALVRLDEENRGYD